MISEVESQGEKNRRVFVGCFREEVNKRTEEVKRHKKTSKLKVKEHMYNQASLDAARAAPVGETNLLSLTQFRL